MPIRFRCRKCKTRIKVPDGSEGANVRCPSCNERQRVPAGDASERSAVQPAISDETSSTPAPALADAAPSEAPVAAAQTAATDDPAAALASLTVADETAEPRDPHDVAESVDESVSDEASSPQPPDDEGANDAAPSEREEADPDTSLESKESEIAAEAPAPEAAEEPANEAPDEAPTDSAAPSPPPFYPKPKPRPTPQPQPQPQPQATPKATRVASSTGQSAPPGSSRRPAPAQPRVIATSSRPAEHRPAARPVPLTEPSTSGLPSAGGSLSATPEPFVTPTRTPPPQYAMLNALTWLLRIWAILLVPVIVKEMLEQFDTAQTLVTKLLGALKLLGWPVLVWAVAEVVAVARRVAQQTHRG